MSLEYHGKTWPEWETIHEELKKRFDVVKKADKSILICKNSI